MKETAHKLSSLTVFEIRNDRLIDNFRKICSDDIDTAISAYSDIVAVLLKENVTLADYLSNLLTYAPAPIVGEYLKSQNQAQLYAIEYDISVIKELAKLSAHRLKDRLFEKFNENFIFSLPEYVCGGFEHNAQYFINHIKENGSGIYAKYKAFIYENDKITPIDKYDVPLLSQFKKYDIQRELVVNNTRAFAEGFPADNVLLYGDRGTGKSSTVKALAYEFPKLRIIQVDKRDAAKLPDVYKTLCDSPLKFIIFIDDLSFNENDEGYTVMKKMLEGSVYGKPSNILIYATTNRRHLIKETESSRTGDNVHLADEIDESLSLADRFGLFVTFLAPGREVYLEIVHGMVADRKIIIDREKLDRCAERFALKRNGRSPRVARQFVDSLQSKIALGIDIEK